MATSAKPIRITPETSAERSIGQCAYAAIKKHFSKMTRYESEVLADTDPEALHQMRVGMRRLRTTLQTYGFVVQLPDDAQESHIKKLGRTLGRVRDLDVLIQKLEQDYRPRLPADERSLLDHVLAKQHRHRCKYFAKLTNTLKGKRYTRLKAAYKTWFKSPSYQPLAHHSIDLMVPDLLLPIVSQMFLHPGWWVGGDLPSEDIDPHLLNRWLDKEGVVLHSLRKQIKHVRYQSEFLSAFYGVSLDMAIAQFKAIQDLLGQLQDCWVLDHVLRHDAGDRWHQQAPTLVQQLVEERHHLWQTWRPIQQQFLDPAYRSRLRQTIATH